MPGSAWQCAWQCRACGAWPAEGSSQHCSGRASLLACSNLPQTASSGSVWRCSRAAEYGTNLSARHTCLPRVCVAAGSGWLTSGQKRSSRSCSTCCARAEPMARSRTEVGPAVSSPPALASRFCCVRKHHLAWGGGGGTRAGHSWNSALCPCFASTVPHLARKRAPWEASFLSSLLSSALADHRPALRGAWQTSTMLPLHPGNTFTPLQHQHKQWLGQVDMLTRTSRFNVSAADYLCTLGTAGGMAATLGLPSCDGQCIQPQSLLHQSFSVCSLPRLAPYMPTSKYHH